MRPELQGKKERIVELVRDMDVPVCYQDRIPWLSKHLAERNSQHPDFPEAMGLVEELLKAGVR